MIDGLLAIGLALVAAAFLVRRALRTLSGATRCGCGSAPRGGAAPCREERRASGVGRARA